jgi:ethanolamine ammonia-lyase small subunit
VSSPVVANPWHALRRYTSARIALGRAGVSLPTAPLLEFQLAHAQARDAVYLPFDATGSETRLRRSGSEVLRVRSAAPDRASYVRRPDLGRALDAPSRALLQAHADETSNVYDIVFVIADGLSAPAVHAHAVAVLELSQRSLVERGWYIAPFVIAEQARVALGDEIGELLKASEVAILIGERPGLSSADSLSIYLTWAPRPGRSDAERNCISNIRPGGLSYRAAAHKLIHLMSEARRRKLTGVELKDESDFVPLEETSC